MERTSERNDSRDPSAIERDIAETRESIDSTVEELGQRLAPSQLVDEAKTFVKEKAMRGATTIWARMSENAVPLALIGGGVVWMLRSDRENIGNRYGDGRESHVADGAREMADQVRERATEMTTRAKETTTRLTERARERAEALREEQPLLLGVASFALGALVGGLMPMTRREDQLLGSTRDQVVEAAAEAAREKAEQAREGIEQQSPSGDGGQRFDRPTPNPRSGEQRGAGAPTPRPLT